MTTVPTGELLRRVLRAAGVDGLYGEPLGMRDRSGPEPVTVVPRPVAELLAAVHHRVHGGRAGVHGRDRLLRLAPLDASPAHAISVGSPGELLGAVATLCRPGAIDVSLDLDLDEPVADASPAPIPTDDRWMIPGPEALDRLRGAASPVVLAGPGVVSHGAVTGLHDLAVAAGVGVLNTWGAKGVFDWRSRHHLATVGLQARDYELGGLADTDLIVATGLDRRESPDGTWELAPVVHLDPRALAPAAEHCAPAGRSPAMPPLRSRLAEVTQEGWARQRAPLSPSRITLHYAEWLASGGLVAADAGTAGFWVARTFTTTRPGAALVAPSPSPGFAAACVMAARLRRPDQPALAVVDGPADEATLAVLEAAATLGIRVPVEMWDDGGEALDADAHRARLARLVLGAAPRSTAAATLASDAGQMAALVDAAGPIVAWT